jgi:hypothetical protein
MIHRKEGFQEERTNKIMNNWNVYMINGPYISNGKYHREDGPAVEFSDGYKFWYLHGKLHREDGPAIDWAASKEFWINGTKFYKEQDYWKEIEKRKSLKFILSNLKIENNI